MWSQYAGVQASVTLHDVGAGMLEIRASYSAKERGIIVLKKPATERENFHEHML